jgi:rhamnosyltransferase
MSKNTSNYTKYPKVAILLATFNGSLYLKNQINSLFEQSNAFLSIFIRDDGSSDDTLDIIGHFVESNQNCFLLNDKFGNQKSPAKNFFALLSHIDMESFDYVLFCDQDDLWMPDKVSQAIRTLNTGSFDAYSSDLILWDGIANIGILKKPVKQREMDYLFQGASAGCTYAFSQKAARFLQNKLQSTFLQLEVTSSHDWLCYAILRSYGFRWVHDSEAKILYRQHNQNAYGANTSLKKLKKMWTLIKENWYGQNVLLAYQFSSKSKLEQAFLQKVFSRSLITRLTSILEISKTRRDAVGRLLLAVFIIWGWLKDPSGILFTKGAEENINHE